MRTLFAAAAIVLMAVMGAPQGANAQEPGQGIDPGKEAEFVACINELRSSQGLHKLEVHGQLLNKARNWAEVMANEGAIRHSVLTEGITVEWQSLGENVGKGGTVGALCDAFEASPSHYENLIDPGFRNVGIGVFLDAEGTIYVSEVFMELASQPAPATPAPSSGTPNSSGGGRAQPIGKVSPGTSSEPERPRSAAAPAATAPAPSSPSPQLSYQLDRLRALDG